MKKARLTLMCGLPRCGKDTWIRKNKGDDIIISPDDIRKQIFGHQFHFPVESFVWGVALSMARMLLDQDKSVIVNATNINFGSRGKFISIAKELDASIRVVWLKTSIKTCLKRNAKSNEENKLPDGIIENMAKNFQDPFYEDAELVQVPISKTSSDSVFTCSYYQRELDKMGIE